MLYLCCVKIFVFMQKIGIYCASSNEMDPKYYEAARQLGEWMGREGKTLVYGGIGCGLMEAVAQAVKKNGGTVYGVVPKGLKLKTGPSDAIDVTLWCDDLTDRKTWLVQESDVLVVLPGSVGTLDEAFTTMAGCMVGMHTKRTIFWNIDGYYDGLFAWLDELKGRGVVGKPWEAMMSRVETIDELVELLK